MAQDNHNYQHCMDWCIVNQHMLSSGMQSMSAPSVAKHQILPSFSNLEGSVQAACACFAGFGCNCTDYAQQASGRSK